MQSLKSEAKISEILSWWHDFFKSFIKSTIMKNAAVKQTSKPVQTKSIQTRPENKDDIDSRKNEEFLTKGDDVTHNKRQTKADKIGEKSGK